MHNWERATRKKKQKQPTRGRIDIRRGNDIAMHRI